METMDLFAGAADAIPNPVQTGIKYAAGPRGFQEFEEGLLDSKIVGVRGVLAQSTGDGYAQVTSALRAGLLLTRSLASIGEPELCSSDSITGTKM